jgi:hypothetical protein
VLLNKGPSAGNIAVIVEIIDHNRVSSDLLYPENVSILHGERLEG